MCSLESETRWTKNFTLDELFRGKTLKQIKKEVAKLAVEWAIDISSGRHPLRDAAKLLNADAKTLFRYRKKFNV